VEILLNHSADDVTAGNNAAFRIAASAGQFNVVEFLLENAYADPNDSIPSDPTQLTL
jgi:hypothetical protein